MESCAIAALVIAALSMKAMLIGMLLSFAANDLTLPKTKKGEALVTRLNCWSEGLLGFGVLSLVVVLAVLEKSHTLWQLLGYYFLFMGGCVGVFFLIGYAVVMINERLEKRLKDLDSE